MTAGCTFKRIEHVLFKYLLCSSFMNAQKKLNIRRGPSLMMSVNPILRSDP
ncbi:hypothetical protein BSU04_19930 [Caballeronia sordidicola]|uniref:Uncharacterized protein n=1 Tax=Caballeronia sordidicola TaxID=196367 RepID=A0A226X0M3_CABSO|nr:hypothetical protein BSU04_19930 [Caballeronia sordidicola]